MAMNKKQRAEAFERLAADPGKEWREGGWSAMISWEKLAATSKVAWIAAHAAVYEVSFEEFEKAVRGAFGGKEVPLEQGSTLRGCFDGACAFLGPAAEPQKRDYHETLNRYAQGGSNKKEKNRGIEH